MERHFIDNRIYKKDTAGKPMTPSRWEDKAPTYREVTRIKMTCGGGMGGESWYEVVERIDFDDFTPDKFITARNWKGKEICINPNYIVKVEQFTLASAILDSQNTNYKVGLHEYNWLVEDGHKIKLVNDFGSYGE